MNCHKQGQNKCPAAHIRYMLKTELSCKQKVKDDDVSPIKHKRMQGAPQVKTQNLHVAHAHCTRPDGT